MNDSATPRRVPDPRTRAAERIADKAAREARAAAARGDTGPAMKPGTGRVRQLLAAVDHPERSLAVIHVAGTNGKGSTCTFIAHALRAAGRRVGVFTSPAPGGIDESITIDGAPADAAVIDAVWARIEPVLKDADASAFEAETGLALGVFAAAGVDVAVIEAGLGGENDATNVFAKPLTTVITNVTLEHTAILGTDVGAIALDKAGILRAGVPFVTASTGDARDVLMGAADEIGAPFHAVDDLEVTVIEARSDGSRFSVTGLGGWDGEYAIRLAGAHQVMNAAAALTALSVLPAPLAPSRDPVVRGFADATIPCRLEWLPTKPGRPRILVDGAHNPAAVRALVEYVTAQGLKPVILFGVLADKEYVPMVESLAAVAQAAVVTQPPHPRALAGRESAREFSRTGAVGMVVDGIDHALRTALGQAGEDGVVLVTGSLALAADVRARILAVLAA